MELCGPRKLNMITPRPYLSHSQKSLLKRSPKQYRKVYLEGSPSFSNKEMGFGSIIAELLDKDELSGDPATDYVLSQVPRLGLPEHEFYAMLVAGNKTVPLIAKPDSIEPDYSEFIEYKTGRNAWTQAKVDKDPQLTFYATCIWLAKRKKPRIRLVWIETEEYEDGNGRKRVQFTGRKPKVFETTRDMGDILRMEKEMMQAWDEIKRMTEEALI